MISAHPDDIEAAAGIFFFSSSFCKINSCCFEGGLVLLLTKQGTKVYYLILTNGDKGCSNPICQDWNSEQIAVARAQEAINAAKVLGVPDKNVILLDYEDGMMVTYPEIQIMQSLVSVIRNVKPNVRFLHPSMNEFFHWNELLGCDDLVPISSF